MINITFMNDPNQHYTYPPQTPAMPVPPQPAESQPPAPRTRLKSWLTTVMVLLAAPLAALLLTAFVFQSYEVDGPSMESTLQHNDRLIVLKLARTWSRFTRKPYIPKRGEIIIFVKHGVEEFNESNKQLIKRVIALPGERVVVNNGFVTVFNQESPGGFQPDKAMPYGQALDLTTSGNQDLTVPPGEIYVLGDNRDNSLDSRVFGTVKSSDIVGELVLRLFPLNKIDKF